MRAPAPPAEVLAARPTSPPTGVAGDAAVPPAGLRRLVEKVEIEGGDWERAADALLRWELHRAAGMTVATGEETVRVGATVVSTATFGPVAVRAPCRVVAVVDEPARRGFVYATLPGHPLVGEELFSFAPARDGRGARFHLESFSRPTGLAALAPPLARAGQRIVNRRFAAAARRLAT